MKKIIFDGGSVERVGHSRFACHMVNKVGDEYTPSEEKIDFDTFIDMFTNSGFSICDDFELRKVEDRTKGGTAPSISI